MIRMGLFSRLICTLLAGLFIMLLCMDSYAADSHHSEAWKKLKTVYFSDRDIQENADDILMLEVPERVEDAAVFPITIKSLSVPTKKHYIKTLHLIVDNNPQPYSAAFHLSPTLGPLVLSTRIRMDSFSNVRVIAEMNDDSLHMIEKFVIASGGCSAPSSKDSAALLANLGAIKIRMRKPTVGEVTTVQTIIIHPNANGMQMNPNTGEYIPMHYVTNFDISFNNDVLIRAETGFTLSETPSIRFNFTPKTKGVLQVRITDSNKAVYSAEKVIDGL